jgi:hypothetical protein
MRRSERLLDNEKYARRTIADAIGVLHKRASFGERDYALIRVDLLPLPSCERIAQVHVVYESLVRDVTYFVWLPSASKFKALRDGNSELEIFDIFELDGGTIEFDGSVFLSDGIRLRAVEVVPEVLPYELSDLEWRILHHTICFMKVEDRVLRSRWEGLSARFQKRLPAQLVIDFSRLIGLNVPLLKQIRGYISDKDSPARIPSAEKIAATLKKCGMRIPPSRPRRSSKKATFSR